MSHDRCPKARFNQCGSIAIDDLTAKSSKLIGSLWKLEIRTWAPD